MIKTFEKFSQEERILGVDLDGVLNNFTEGYNVVYKKHFPDYDIVPSEKVDDWNWWIKYNYDEEKNKFKWFKDHKAETWHHSKPYPGAIESIKTIYQWTQKEGIILKIVTMQLKEDAEREAIKWLTKYGVEYDDISFAKRSSDKWDAADIMIDDGPSILECKPFDRVSIKVNQLYNIGIRADFNVDSMMDLTPYIVKKAFEKLNNMND